MTSIQPGAKSIKRILTSHNGHSHEPERQNTQRSDAVKKGWLFKQGGVIKSWHKRWFVLKGDQLFYYTSQDENKQLGTIFLPGNKIVELPTNANEPEKYPFEIQPGSDKSRMTLTHETYPLQASSDDERKYWIQAIKKVMFGDKGGAIFGQTLLETMTYEARTSNRKVPKIVEMCVEFLLKHGLETEGIFRLPGRTALIKRLKEVFDSGENVDFVIPDIDIHTVASLLKLYLRELPEPIVPRQFYEPVMKIVQRDMPLNPEKSLNSLQALLTHIPKSSYNLIQYLCHFLHEVSSHSDVNKMTAMNLATVFVHCMIRPEDEDPALLMGTANGRTQVTFMFITKWEKLFKMEYNAQGTAVKVDNLLDIDTTTESIKFNPDTSTPITVPGLGSSDDLLNLVLGSSDVGVPEPILVPDTENGNVIDSTTIKGDDPNYATIKVERSDSTDIDSAHLYSTVNELDPLNVPHQSTDEVEINVQQDTQQEVKRNPPPIPLRPAPLPPPRSVSSDELSNVCNESNSPPKALKRSKSGSIQKPRPRKMVSSGGSDSELPAQTEEHKSCVSIRDSDVYQTPPPTPPKPKSGSFSSFSPEKNVSASEKPIPARPAPPPPVNEEIGLTENTSNSEADTEQRLKSKKSNSIVDSTDSTDASSPLNEDESDERLQALLNTDTRKYTNIDCQNYISELKSELIQQRVRMRELHSKMSELIIVHKKQLQDMAHKVDQEKSATANAVEKIINLQDQLQSYKMRYDIND